MSTTSTSTSTSTGDASTSTSTTATGAAPQQRKRVVVGTDGSEAAKVALRVAAEEARLHHAALQVVRVWAFPAYVDPMGGVYPMPGQVEATAEAEAAALKEEIASVLGPSPFVDVVPTSICGSTSSELLKAAEGADMLVVGSHGRGGFLSLVLGSTATQCVHHATCPVLVVREGMKA